MNNITTTYWIVTILFSVATLTSGRRSFFLIKKVAAVTLLLGYPAYMFVMLGVAKILRLIAILQTRFKTLKE